MAQGVIVGPQSPRKTSMRVVVLVSVQSSISPGQFPALERTEEPGAAFHWDPVGALAHGLCQADIVSNISLWLKSPPSHVYTVHAGL